MDAFVAGALERQGRIDVLVNNAGGQFLSPAEAISPKGFRTVIELNVQGTWLMTHAAATGPSSLSRAARSSASPSRPTTGCPGWSTPEPPGRRSRT